MHIRLSPNDSRNNGDGLLECDACGYNDLWIEASRGGYYCQCETCPECGCEPGWHGVGCSVAVEYNEMMAACIGMD